MSYFSNGEPFLNPDLAPMIRESTEAGVFPVISTNLSFSLGEARIDEILTSGAGIICCSIDGVREETYRRYRVGGRFDLAFANMRRLVERRRELGLEAPLIEWRFLVFEHNEHEIAEAGRLAAEIGVDILEFFRGNAAPAGSGAAVVESRAVIPGPAGPALDRARAAASGPVRARLAAGDLRHPPERPVAEAGRCDWLYLGSMIYPDGSVAPCCLASRPEHDLGRLSVGDGFLAVYNGEPCRRARSLFRGERQEGLLCARCPHSPSQHDQFRNTLRAVIRNAPTWAAEAMARDADLYFDEADHALMPEEMAALSAIAGETAVPEPTGPRRRSGWRPPAVLRRRAFGRDVHPATASVPA